MSPSLQPLSPADARHWRRSRRLAALLTLIWLAVSFGPLLFARDLGFEFAGAPLVIWLCSQGVPILYVVLVWRYERGMERLDAQHRAGHVD